MGELGVHPFSDGMKSNTGITNAPNPFIPKTDQFKISPAAPPAI